MSTAVVVNVYPQLVPGSIAPSSLTLASGTSPGILTSQPATGGSGTYNYQWQSSTDGINFTNITGATALTFNAGNITSTIWYQMSVTSNGASSSSAFTEFSVGTPPTNLNYIRTRELSKAGITDTITADSLSNTYDVHQNIIYFDGLGRPIQSVDKQASPLQNDMVSFNVYDPSGRESITYLPYTSSSHTGLYKTDAVGEQSSFNSGLFPSEQYYYGQAAYEPSALDRVVESFAPGNSWVGANHGVAKQYQINNTADSVVIWSINATVGSLPLNAGNYASSTLYKDVTIDEAGHVTVQYTDLQEHLVLKKVQIASNPATGPSGWLNTYYIYDTIGNLRFVIPPAATQWLQNNGWSFTAAGAAQMAANLCFRYEYDYRSQLNIKKVPGAGEEWLVYDLRDRMVMTQDSNLRSQGKWIAKQYDNQNRPDSAGLITDNHNLSYHQNLAATSAYYPVVASYPYQLQREFFYDNYNWVPSGVGLSSSMNTSSTGNGSYFITSYNTAPNYSVPITPFPIVRGHETGKMAYIVGSTTGQTVTSVYFYDDRNRVIQLESINISGGVDVMTSQYDFIGEPLRRLWNHTKNGLPAPQQHSILSKYTYDPSFRLKTIFKNIDGAAADQLIDSMQYDELGRIRAKYLGNNVDSLLFAYNIRGWLIGINPNYVAGTANGYFGMELGYDKPTSVAPGNTYSNPGYSGTIAGTVWKTAGSGVNRKYDFAYDLVNRLTAANFSQYNGSGFDKSANIDFTVSNLSYDLNGNILTMTQKGYTVGGSNAIDSLAYSYANGGTSNQLATVTDAANNSTSLLGDFHYDPANKTSTDFAYDGNGNIKSDNNKRIDSIGYNYLDLPQYVHVKGKGNVSYTYDAWGQKWRKTITDSLSKHSTTISYIDGIVYDQIDSINNPGGGIDTLQFIDHEEGRARWAYHKYLSAPAGYRFEYDFYEKDHLGNPRMVLTQQRDTTNYIATMEYAYRSSELQLFNNISNTSVAWTSMPNYQNIPNNLRFAYTSPNDSVSRVDYNGVSGQTTGPSLLLKVMSGDTVSIGVQCYYATNTLTTANSSLNSVLNSLAAGIMGTPSGAAEGTLGGYTATNGPVYSGLSSFLSTKDPTPPSGYPKAYLNWILLDDQFNYVSSSSGAVAAASSTYPANQMNTVAPGSPVVMSRNGYLYMWVSNETQGWDVYFDNFSVQYKQGPVLEENHFYPYGLTMVGLSDKALKANYYENKYRFNKGSELQNKEFSDGTGLELYETYFRSYDPQLGRFGQPDPLAPFMMEWSPYCFAFDNPVSLDDRSGLAVDSTGKGGKGSKGHHPKPRKEPKWKVLPTAVVTAKKRPHFPPLPAPSNEPAKDHVRSDDQKMERLKRKLEQIHDYTEFGARASEYAKDFAEVAGWEQFSNVTGKIGTSLTAVNMVFDAKEGKWVNVTTDALSFVPRLSPYIFWSELAKGIVNSDWTLSNAIQDEYAQYEALIQKSSAAFKDGDDNDGWEYSNEANEVWKNMANLVNLQRKVYC